MSKLLGLGAVRRVALDDRGANGDSSDEEGVGVMQSGNDSMEMEDALYATVFDDGEDGIGGIAARVSRRRSSARMSGGSALAVTPGKGGATPGKKTASGKKMSVIKEDRSSENDRVDKENEGGVNSRGKSAAKDKNSRLSGGSGASPLRTLGGMSAGKEDKRASSSSSSSSHNVNKVNEGGDVVGDREDSAMMVEEPSHPWSIEDFSVGKSIGRGKFGNVYSARQKMPKDKNGKRLPGTGALVALKVLFKAPMVAAKCIHNLRREVEIQSRLKHPNIVQLYGYFDDAKSVYLILQHINGGEVYKYVRRNTSEGRVEEWLCRTMMHDAMSALAYMHARHVYHRDLKAENLLLCYQERDGEEKVRVVLGDFGWAVHAPPPCPTRYTMCGTPEYLSPEMLSGGGHEHHVDLWSCGVLMFELLTGTTPFVQGDEENEAGADFSGDEENEGQNEQAKVFARISRHAFGGIDLADTAYGATSEAAAFINALLHPVPGTRPEAAQALEHPWMKLEPIKRS